MIGGHSHSSLSDEDVNLEGLRSIGLAFFGCRAAPDPERDPGALQEQAQPITQGIDAGISKSRPATDDGKLRLNPCRMGADSRICSLRRGLADRESPGSASGRRRVHPLFLDRLRQRR